MRMIGPTWEFKALRVAGFVEGVTLISLLGVAVPLKHVMGIPGAVSVVGPIHGITFMVYIVLTLMVVSGGGWTSVEAIRTAGASFLPFGTFLNDAMLRRKAEELSD